MDDSNISKIILAKWSDRFLAWLIDFMIISLISTIIIFGTFGTINYEFGEGFWAENSQYIPTSIIFFVYWIVLEYKTSQSIGKKIMNLKITDINGDKPSFKGIIISSFGKAFLLPFDLALGRIITNEKRQRIFNRLGDTVVIKIKISEEKSESRYIKD
jgi:uncharacterized RDD family membrane protein YckC